ncbi:MAG: hypothetical protein AAF620_13520 [Bacteroidota bacterium]
METAGIHQPYAVKTITEAALLGALMEKGMAKDMVLLSDDAGQFTILTHALCWIYVERNLQKIHTYTSAQRQTLDRGTHSFLETLSTTQNLFKTTSPHHPKAHRSRF